MNIFRFVIHRKVLVSMIFLAFCMLGVVSYRQLPVELMPNAEMPFLIVQVSSTQEMNPEYMEKQAIIPLEGVIGTLEGVSNIESTAEQRGGTIYVYFNQNVNIKYAYLKLQQKIYDISYSIPEEFRISVVKIDTERLSNSFMRLQVRGSGGLERVRAIIDKSILDELENIDGIAHVEVTGGQVQSLEIILNDEAVEAFNITPGRIRQLISQNAESRNFIGHAYEKDKQYFVNLVADYTDIRQLENIVVNRTGPILLKDISTVVFGVKEPESISRVNGKDALTVNLIRDANTNIIDLSHETRDVIERLNGELKPLDVEIVIQSDTAEEMEQNINLIIELAIVGSILAVIILWFFMKNVRLVLTVLLSIPISVLTAFIFFYFFDITLNSLTLVGMALAVGMLLDNSVVVLENIYRHISLHKDRTTATIIGAQEVWRSIVASTLTTITVFLPFIFSSEYLVKMIGRHVGVSIISTLLVSLIVALTLIPMMTHALLRDSDRGRPTFNKISQKNRLLQIYTLLLKSAMRFPVRTIFAAVIVFFVSILLCMKLSFDVARELDLKEFTIYITMPSGSTLDRSDTITTEIENMLADIEEIQDKVTTIYEDEATITIVLKDNYEEIADKSIAEVKNIIEQRVRDYRRAEVSLSEPQESRRFGGGGMGGNSMASLERMFGIGSQQEKVVLKGNDFSLLREVADDIVYFLDELDTVSRAGMNVASARPELHLLFDNQLLSHNNISISSIASELQSFQSEVSSEMTYKVGSEEYDIIIRNESLEEEKNFEDLSKLHIQNESAASYELQQLGQIIYASGMSSINRINQEKQIEITYAFENEVNDSKALLETSRQEVEKMIASLSIPTGVAIEVVHDETDLSEFYFLIGAAFILIFMILASVFESVLTPVVMMFTIPLATIGSFWALILTGNSLFNTNSLIGFLILLGVVVNNGIILIDYTNILRRRGYRRSRALLTAGQARVRPILITAITTIVAMFPLAMGKAEYVTRIGAPFAITVIGGLTVSTLFTLIFIPTLYSGLESAVEWVRKLDPRLNIIQAAIFITSCVAINYQVESLLWKYAYMFFALVAIPGLTWFVLTSLRQARADFLRDDRELTISIGRLVKIYDDYSRFTREWRKGDRMEKNMGIFRTYTSIRDFEPYTWQLPLLGFFIYFIYFYLSSSLWLFFLSHIVYFYALFLLKPIKGYLKYRSEQTSKKYYTTMSVFLSRVFIWGIPLVNLVIFYRSEFKTAILIFIVLLWYSILIIYTTSNRLFRHKVNIMRLKGRFAGIRRHFYRFIRVIPIIGKKRNPFNALDGVSLNIQSGMFGLLGPNGAGKTTLMRIVCGILTQNMGTIRINNITYKEKREELQGLIGYLPQEFGTYENMTAYEFLDYIAILKNIFDKKERDKIVTYGLKSVHLIEHKDRKIGSFSGGMKQRMGIAMTLLHLPRILVVDEPTAGLDPRERIRFRNLLVELSRERIVIFSTHIIEDISSSCNKVAVLDKGSLYYLGEPREMTGAAEGKVWQFHVNSAEFESLRTTLRIVHHMRVEDKIRVRCLSELQPYPNAEHVEPTLEDAYLWLVRKEQYINK
ncbi:MAG: efflux RND transporter permease subunit [Candidatus Latescibacteria bacterium]|nr:efflux RND transporter permease subunit [Candidatus Latescibacterota bacterium]